MTKTLKLWKEIVDIQGEKCIDDVHYFYWYDDKNILTYHEYISETQFLTATFTNLEELKEYIIIYENKNKN